MINPIWEADEVVELCAAVGGDEVLAKRRWKKAWLRVRCGILSCLTTLKQGEAPFVFIECSCYN